jgi:alkylglycerol monooxygenase
MNRAKKFVINMTVALRLRFWAERLFFAVLLPCIGVYSARHSLWHRAPLDAHLARAGPQTDWIKAAYPFFVLAIAAEVAVAWATGRLAVFRVVDGIGSVWEGSLSQLVGMFLRPLMVYPFVWVRVNFALLTLDDSSAVHWVLAFVLQELVYYWFHRLSHELNALWSGHMVHHSSQEYNLTTALRQGVTQSVFSWAFQPALGLFLSWPMYHFHNQWNTLYQFWIHTRLIGKLWWPIELVFNTPSHHRVHHGRNPQYIDKNYGGTLIVFDRLFGTFEPEGEEVVYGITKDVGTWNPVWHQVVHWQEMWRTACHPAHDGWVSRVRVFLDRGPEYNYFLANPGHRANPPPAITRATEKRYDSWAATAAANAYAVTWGVLSILLAIIVLTEWDALASAHHIPAALLLAAAMVGPSMVLDRKPSALWFELARLAVSAAALAAADQAVFQGHARTLVLALLTLSIPAAALAIEANPSQKFKRYI